MLRGPLQPYMRRSVYSHYNLICRSWLLSLGALPFSQGEGEEVDLGEKGAGVEELGGEEGGATAIGM